MVLIRKHGIFGLKRVNNLFRYAVLGSGSSANSYIFEFDQFSFILDNGFSRREIEKRMRTLSFDPSKLEFIFLSHIHSDHLKGVELLSRDLKIPVVHNENLDIDKYIKNNVYHKLEVSPLKEYSYKHLKFVPFTTSHDAPSSLSYYFEFGGKKITVITDTGIVNDDMFNFAVKSDILFLESNYSESMLESGSYPYFLKKRISSDLGHLSNFQSARFLQKLYNTEKCAIKQIYLCHLSKNNNTVNIVEKEIQSIYTGNIPYEICPRDQLIKGL